MIWFRRFLTIPLIFICLVLLLVAILITAINNTVANPGFYNNQMTKADVYNDIYDQILPAVLDEVKPNESSDLSLNVSDYKSEIVAAAEQTLPPEWLRTQFESATCVLIPYIVDDKDGFTYTVFLKDTVEEAGAAIKYHILNSSAFSDLYDELTPYLAQKVYDDLGDVTSETGVTKSDIEAVLLSLDKQDWLRTQIEKVIDAVIPYMIGEANSFSVSISTQDVLNDSVILIILGPGNEVYLDAAKSLITNGLTFTDQDLRDQVDVETFDKVHGWIINGYTVTQDNLRNSLANSANGLNIFDNTRHYVSEVRTWLWVLWVVPFVILIGIGFLGGRGWKTRAAGPLVILLSISFVIFLSVILAWSHYGEQEMTEALHQQQSDSEGLQAVVMTEIDEIAVNAVGDFMHNIQDIGLYMAIASGVGLTGVGVWAGLGSHGKKLGYPRGKEPRLDKRKRLQSNGSRMGPPTGTPFNARCPICGSNTRILTAKGVFGAGRKYYVCSRHPKCKGRIPVKNVKQSADSQAEYNWSDW